MSGWTAWVAELYGRDPVAFLRLVVAALGLGSLVLVWRQLRLTNTWNRLSSQHDLVKHLPRHELEQKIFKHLADTYGLEKTQQVTPQIARQLWGDKEIYYPLKEFINSFERFSAAVYAGSIDAEYAFETQRSRLLYIHHIFAAFIEEVREQIGNPIFGAKRKSVWIEMENLAADWKKREMRVQRRAERIEQFGAWVRAKLGRGPRVRPRV